MVATKTNYDRKSEQTEVKAFDETKEGVKGLVDAGITELISNDRFKSIQHRVLANYNPPKYRETTVTDYVAYFNNKGLSGTSALSNFKL
ncbi:unnamed protein product [Malus baccata var. baccata]